MPLIAIGLNHRTAPVHVRERLSVAETKLPELIASLTAMSGVDGAAIVSTCNRVETYVSAADEDLIAAIVDWLAERARAPRAEIEKKLYILRPAGVGEAPFPAGPGPAVPPLSPPPPALASMTPGEPQIQGQVRAAFMASQRCGALDPLLTQLFEPTTRVAKRGCHDTGLAPPT